MPGSEARAQGSAVDDGGGWLRGSAHNKAQVPRPAPRSTPRARHRRQRQTPGLIGIDRSKSLLEKPPVDRAGDLRQRVAQVDDLVEPSPKQVVLSALPPLVAASKRPPPADEAGGITAVRATQFARQPARQPTNPAIAKSSEPPKTSANQGTSAIFADERDPSRMPTRALPFAPIPPG
jgi:hypothetical protein